MQDNELLVFTVTGNPEASISEIRMSANWSVKRPVQVIPRSGAFFGRVTPKDGILTRKIFVQSEIPFRICGVDAHEANGLTVVHSDVAHERHLVTVELDASKVSHLLRGEIELTVDHPLQRKTAIPYAALGN